MAQKTIVVLTDDLDGTEIAEGNGETVTFGLDGKTYEIDLTGKNADKLRGVFRNYISAGRKAGGTSRGVKRTTTTNAREVRDWARSNGYDVPDRGRIPRDVQGAFDAR